MPQWLSNCLNTGYGLGRDNNPNQNVTSDTDSYTLTQTLDMEIGTLMLISNHREIENYNGTWGWGMGSGNSSTTTTTNLLDVINNPSKNDIDSHELRLSGDTGNLSWTVGAYIFEEDNFGEIDVPVLRGYTTISCRLAYVLSCYPWSFKCCSNSNGYSDVWVQISI